ncbi:helix-turn-helix transcriptional regulator [Actinomadura hibisca]|uniref:helix-turn-helix transcriptional regulator n=1 Tax=Actinomadura hibisca TaxID=68565 RepID=UPI00248100A9|nr:LuxR family transcriptional regulator [Actinomadura hibisca]
MGDGERDQVAQQVAQGARVAPRGALIGRAAEFGMLAAALDKADGGSAGVALVSGDAGVGKSHLTGALAAAARERGWTVLAGQCAELGESIPYLPLADALWSGVRDPAAGRVRDALGTRPVLGRLLPDAGGGPDGVSELGQQQLFGAVLGLLGELGADRPVLLVLEDLHWADRSTRHLLTFLSRVLQRERVCLVGTYRSDDLHRRHPLRPVVAELLRLPNVAAVDLRPFGPGETAEYLAFLDGGRAPSAEEAARVHQRSEGNAFYAAELHAAARSGEELPAGLADLLLARMERLSDQGQRVVRVAAVAGRRVNDELVRRVSGLDEQAVGEALREIVSHQLLVPDGAEGYRFRHALLAEAVYADLLPGERTRLHAAFAALLAEPPARDLPRAAAERAHHSMAAHDLPVAFAASVRAGREADEMGAPDEAVEHYDRALELWEAVPGAAETAGTDRVRLSLAAALATARAGDRRPAVHRLRRLLELADPADVRLGVRIRENLASSLSDIDEEVEALEVAREAVAMLPADPPTPERAAALAAYVRILHFQPGHEAVPELAAEAMAAARATGAADAEASALVTLALYRESLEADPEAVGLFGRARDLAIGTGNHPVALRAAFQYARALFERGDLARATAAADEGVAFALANGVGWSTYGTTMRCLQYLIHYASGDWARAGRLAEDFAVQAVRTPEAQVSAYALFTEIAQGDPVADERLRWIAPLWSQDTFLAFVARGLAAEHALWRGDTGGGLAHARAALDALYPYDAGAVRVAATALWALADRVAAGEQPDLEAAEVLVKRARDAASLSPNGAPRAWFGMEGKAWLARAEADYLRAVGRNDPEAWRRSAKAFTYGDPDGGFRYEVARSRWRLAEALVEHGDREGAAEAWRPAVAAAERLGAAPLLAALRDLGTRARLENGRGGGEGAGPLAALTAREHEVLKLVAEGLGNKEIAAALYISPKTASVHVSNIMGKLGVTGRTQAAAIAHRAGLLSAADPGPGPGAGPGR